MDQGIRLTKGTRLGHHGPVVQITAHKSPTDHTGQKFSVQADRLGPDPFQDGGGRVSSGQKQAG